MQVERKKNCKELKGFGFNITLSYVRKKDFVQDFAQL